VEQPATGDQQQAGTEHDASRFLPQAPLDEGDPDQGEDRWDEEAGPAEQVASGVLADLAGRAEEVEVDAKHGQDGQDQEHQPPHVIGLPAEHAGEPLS
jgi:hypothetical protein